MSKPVKVAFASASVKLIPDFLERLEEIVPGPELYVVSEFPPARGRWIPYRFDRSFLTNHRRCREALRGCRIVYAGVVLQPKVPYTGVRILSLLFAPLRTLFFNEYLDHFMLRPRSLSAIVRYLAWRLRSFLAKEFRPGGTTYTWVWRLQRPREMRWPVYGTLARIAGRVASLRKSGLAAAPERVQAPLHSGLSVIIPSRNGRNLLEALLPALDRELDGLDAEAIVTDNGSSDGTAEFLNDRWPQVRIEWSEAPLSFARAVNQGIAAARFSHVCLLNNDMEPHHGFIRPLLEAFQNVPCLFCATAQIYFPEGQRREETGKAVFRWPLPEAANDFPIHCIEPIPGEDLTYVLYGSGGCSVYDTAKLRALGGMSEIYEPAYVEDLDAGYRAWQRGWPTVFVSRSAVTHRHRTTTSRYFAPDELERVLETNFLRFLARAVGSSSLFQALWSYSIERLERRAAIDKHEPSLEALRSAGKAYDWVEPAATAVFPEEMILGLGNGDAAVFPGKAQDKPDRIVVASCYIPFPLSHGGAVRMYNLMRRAARDYAQILVTFVDELHTPPEELLEICVEIIQVKRVGRHFRPDRGQPDVVEDFDSATFHGVLRQTVRKWRASVVQLEFTQTAQYAIDASPAKTILVEHDITIDLYEQLVTNSADFDTREQLERWRAFETRAWREVDCVVAMSEKDRRAVQGARRAVTLANGVDLVRFQLSAEPVERARLLFIGSFAHLPNLLALDFFLREIWPLLKSVSPTLHVIAGARHEFHFQRNRDKIRFPLDQTGMEVEGFVSDVRPAYRRAAVVIAPLLASAGTNIKIMEAMAMGKSIVSTPAGVNGLEVTPGVDVIIEKEAPAFANAVLRLIDDPGLQAKLGKNARATAERIYDWDVIAAQQDRLYRQLTARSHSRLAREPRP